MIKNSLFDSLSVFNHSQIDYLLPKTIKHLREERNKKKINRYRKKKFNFPSSTSDFGHVYSS